MKITKTLITLIQRLDKAEIKRFQAYLQYKKRKRIIALLNVFAQYDNEEELSYQIKRKKLVKNLRHNQKELFKLLRQFWSDNIEKEKPKVEISSLMSFADGIYEKGLTEEALKLIQKAEEIARANNLHHLVYDCNRQQTILNWRHFPDQTEQMMQQYEINQQQTINQIKMTSRVTYLNQRMYYLFFKGLWALSEDQLQFLEEASDEITAILESEDIEINYQIAMLGLANTHSRIIRMDGELASSYGKKALEVLKACPPGFPGKQSNLATAYPGLLIPLMLMDNREEYDKVYADFTAFTTKMENPGLSIRYQTLSAQLLHLRYTHVFNQEMDNILQSANHFLENEGEHLPPVFLGHFFMVIFELYFCCKQFDRAEDYVEKLRQLNNQNDLPDVKFMEFSCEVLLNYENDNFDFIVNRCLAFRRRYSKYLRYNVGGSLMISYFIKLCNATDKSAKSTLYHELKEELSGVFSNIRNRTLFSFWNIEPWIDSKINHKDSIVDWLQSRGN